MNLDSLNNATKKELATRAKTLGIASFESMRKEELVKAIAKALKKKEAAKQAAKEAAGKASSKSSTPPPKPTPAKASAPPPKPTAAKPTPAKPKPAATPSANGNGKHHSNGSHKATATPAPKSVPVPKPSLGPVPSPINRPSITSSTVMGHASPVVHKPTIPGVPHGLSKPVVDPSKTKTVATKDTSAIIPSTAEYYAKPPKYLPASASKDRLIVVVRDPFWLSISWELSPQSIQRAEAALAQDWHGARPILRVLDVSSQDTTSTAERIVRDVEVHGGTNHWYVDVNQPPRTYRIDLGYLSRRGTFHVLCRSNVINTPKAGASEIVDAHWEDVDRKQADQLYSMSGGTDVPRHDEKILQEFLEEKLRRPLAAPIPTPTTGKDKKFFFNLHAELIIWGETAPGSRVTFQGEPIRLRPDGTFAQRYQLPDGRQIFPAIAESPDNSEERKIVLAVERNTKVLEPLTQRDRDLEDDD